MEALYQGTPSQRIEALGRAIEARDRDIRNLDNAVRSMRLDRDNARDAVMEQAKPLRELETESSALRDRLEGREATKDTRVEVGSSLPMLGLVSQEYDSSVERYGSFRSLHEGYAVLLEEVDEVWDLVKQNTRTSHEELVRLERILGEAKQVSAMGLKLMVLTDALLRDLRS